MSARWPLLLLGVGLAACAPPVEGAACRADEHCPTGQRCSVECVCGLANPADGSVADAGSAACPGFRATGAIELPGQSPEHQVQVASETTGPAQVIAVALSIDDDRVPSVRLFQRGAEAWAPHGVVRVDASSSALPVALAPDASEVLVSLASGAALYPLALGGLGTPTTAWSVPVTAVAHGGRRLVASLETVVGPPSSGGGLFTRSLPLSVPLSGPGEQLHVDLADRLWASANGDVIVTLGSGGAVRVFRNGTQRPWTMTAPAGYAAVTLAAGGSRLAWARGRDIEVVDPDSGTVLGRVTLDGVRALALDRTGETLVALATEGAVVFAWGGAGWARVGRLPLAHAPSGVALSGDGLDLFVGVPATQQLRVFRRVR